MEINMDEDFVSIATGSKTIGIPTNLLLYRDLFLLAISQQVRL
jgi:hypothetical protein